ncbi:hypothetical protein [Candidatus Avelusimicrobium alvi]|uniref:hypothetical protein n=1 Tax=Candidatus Avelusimicrobium alvi TaxID=3416221 RepID=UPI003D0E251B
MSGRKNGSFRAADGINLSHIRKNVFALHINNYIAFVQAVQEKNAEAVYFSVGENETPRAHARGFFCFKISASLDFARH